MRASAISLASRSHLDVATRALLPAEQEVDNPIGAQGVGSGGGHLLVVLDEPALGVGLDPVVESDRAPAVACVRHHDPGEGSTANGGSRPGPVSRGSAPGEARPRRPEMPSDWKSGATKPQWKGHSKSSAAEDSHVEGPGALGRRVERESLSSSRSNQPNMRAGTSTHHPETEDTCPAFGMELATGHTAKGPAPIGPGAAPNDARRGTVTRMTRIDARCHHLAVVVLNAAYVALITGCSAIQSASRGLSR